MSHLMNTYARQSVAFVRGEGVWLWDEEGKKYLDALAGIAVNTLGYGHPKLTRALSARIASGVIHTSNLWRIPDQEAAADRVADILIAANNPGRPFVSLSSAFKGTRSNPSLGQIAKGAASVLMGSAVTEKLRSRFNPVRRDKRIELGC